MPETENPAFGEVFASDYNEREAMGGRSLAISERLLLNVNQVYSQPLSPRHRLPAAGRRIAVGWAGLTFRDLLSFAAPAAIVVEFHVGGRLYLTELILLACLPFLLADPARRRMTGSERLVVFLSLTWLWSQIVTDLVRGSAFGDFSRGWSRVAFTLTSFIALALLIGDNRRRIVLFACGLVLGLMLSYRYNPNVYVATEHWKFGIGYPITLAMVVLASHRLVYRIPLLSSSILIAAAAINLLKGFRSLAGICCLAGAYVILQQRARSRSRRAVRATPGQALRLVAIGAVLAFGFIGVYGYAAKQGLLGDRATQKYAQQSAGKYGVVFGGRPETLVELQAVGDSPVLGHGSWAANPKYTLGLLRAMQRAGYELTPGILYGVLHSETIPTHSYLFGAWVEAGLLGAVFWLAIAILAARAIFGLYRISDPLTPLLAFYIFDLLWAIAFSPYGAQERVIAPFIVAAVVLYTNRRLADLSSASQTEPPG